MENERELSYIYRTILDIILYVLMACMAFHGCNCCEADASRNTLRHKALFSFSLSLSLSLSLFLTSLLVIRSI